jgi:hypothetical protein
MIIIYMIFQPSLELSSPCSTKIRDEHVQQQLQDDLMNDLMGEEKKYRMSLNLFEILSFCFIEISIYALF